MRIERIGSGLGRLAAREARVRSDRTQRYFAPEPASPIRYEPDPKFDDIVREAREKTLTLYATTLSCHHARFLFQTCSQCHRDSKQAKEYAKYLKRKLTGG